MSESQINAISNDLFITSRKEQCYQLTFSSQTPLLAGHRNHPSSLQHWPGGTLHLRCIADGRGISHY